MSQPIVIQGFFPHGSPRQRMGAPRGHAVALAPAAFRPAAGPGAPLPPAIQAKMEQAFGTSFAGVRIHVGPEAGALGAAAFAAGGRLYFAPGRYDPHSAHGRRLLAHELCHVVQQRTGRARNPFGAGAALLNDPLLEAEADRMSHRAAAAFASSGAPAARAPARPPAVRAGAPRAVQPCCAWIKPLWNKLWEKKKPTAHFEDQYDLVSLLSKVDDAPNILKDTTCTDGADQMVKLLARGGALSSGKSVSSLRQFMTGKGEDAAKGVVIRCKAGPEHLPAHSFTIEQQGEDCQLYQAWLKKQTLQEGLEKAKVEKVSAVLLRLQNLENSFGGDAERIREKVEVAFGIEQNEESWKVDKLLWTSSSSIISWTAYERQ